ncbi:MAG: recombination protein O N-terminal domain-containing protein [Patescibacteria group bacterium]|nr:recombination protein O N-terminal domain-containing protein [Patescibacteria group bacterium]
MYQKYNTEALVLGSRERGESDRVLALYTRDFGLVRARASAVRKERSKMRYALQHYAHARVSLVRGKRGWRAGGASSIRSARGDTGRIAIFARISELTMRLVRGEEDNMYLFDALSNAHEALFGEESAEAVPTVVEIVCVARVLYALGYISTEALQTTLFAHTGYAGEHLTEAGKLHDELLASINRAISEAQL